MQLTSRRNYSSPIKAINLPINAISRSGNAIKHVKHCKRNEQTHVHNSVLVGWSVDVQWILQGPVGYLCAVREMRSALKWCFKEWCKCLRDFAQIFKNCYGRSGDPPTHCKHREPRLCEIKHIEHVFDSHSICTKSMAWWPLIVLRCSILIDSWDIIPRYSNNGADCPRMFKKWYARVW